MPHVIVKLWPGKSEAQKRDLSDAIVREVTSILNYGDEAVSVGFDEVGPEKYQRQGDGGLAIKAIWHGHVKGRAMMGAGRSENKVLVVRTQFRAPYPGGNSHHYTEIYLGVSRDPLSARIYFSPDYFNSRSRTIYGEINGSVAPARNWSLTAHVGALTYLSQPDTDDIYHAVHRYRALYYDWRLGVMRQLG